MVDDESGLGSESSADFANNRIDCYRFGSDQSLDIPHFDLKFHIMGRLNN